MELTISAGLKEKLERWPIEQVLIWACDTFGPRAAASSSFQTQSVPLLHLISLYCPQLTILFIDTGYHFPETQAFRSKLTRLFRLNVRVIQPESSPQEYEFEHGKVYQSDPDACCQVRKVLPLQQALNGYDAWITGIRHDQTDNRHQAEIIEYHDSLIKINPMIDWPQTQIDRYLDDHNLPRHPLDSAGYKSIGCSPCTQAVCQWQNYRHGRWPGYGKTECGIHELPVSHKSTTMKYTQS